MGTLAHMPASASNWDRGLRSSRPTRGNDTVIISGGKPASTAEVLALIEADHAARQPEPGRQRTLDASPGRQGTIDDMEARDLSFGPDLDRIVDQVRTLLDSANARDRVRGIRHLVAAGEALESRVLRDAQASGMSWSQIGAVYGVSRQAAHQRFADDTVLSGAEFDALLAHLDEPDEVVPALARAANRARPKAPTG